MARITHLGTAVPKNKHSQEQIGKFMQGQLQLDTKASRLTNLVYKKSGIAYRYSVLPDFSSKTPSLFIPDVAITTEQRMAIYDKESLILSETAIRNTIDAEELKEITHLISVSCTGMSAPGLDLKLVRSLGLSTDIVRTSINFMGCYAAIHALKLANAFCNSSEKVKVLIVCTELCTLHFQHTSKTEDILSACLFADGSAACVVDNYSDEGTRIDSFQSDVAFEGYDDMAWEISSHGFLMNLSTYVPKLLEKDLKKLLDRTMESTGISKGDVQHWAIHPGGKNILEATEKALDLDKDALSNSYETLGNFGNMSSPTVLFVLHSILQKADTDEPVFMAAFGPGLTIETCLLHA